MILVILAALVILAVVGIAVGKIALFFRANSVLTEINREIRRRQV